MSVFNSEECLDQVQLKTSQVMISDSESEESKRAEKEVGYLRSMAGMGGFERNNILREAFKVVIQNVVPDVAKIWIYYHRKHKIIDFNISKRL